MKVQDRLAFDRWQRLSVPCESMVELSLVNCLTTPGGGLACVLGKCRTLERLQLDMCVGIRDCDLMNLARESDNLRSISLRVPSDFSLPISMADPSRLIDESLKAFANNCSKLETFKVSFSDGEFPSFSSFTLNGILLVIHRCPIRVLALVHIYSFTDSGMEALCDANFLETLELTKCQEVTDEGLQLVQHFRCLRNLKISKCLGVTDGCTSLTCCYLISRHLRNHASPIKLRVKNLLHASVAAVAHARIGSGPIMNTDPAPDKTFSPPTT
uniref:F-box domain-containing protein n=1 Tax=Nymphaea colorata TaxID=210225 RepID=A0A5K1CCE4_9MAGN